MNILVDTSVWVGHFKQRDERLVHLLENGIVVCHPYVVVEIACGTPPNRRSTIELLNVLENVPVATTAEVIELIEKRNIQGRGCGFVDVSLLASALISERTLVWTLDKRLEAIAVEFGLAYQPSLHG